MIGEALHFGRGRKIIFNGLTKVKASSCIVIMYTRKG